MLSFAFFSDVCQKTARIFGWLFIATFVTSIGARFLFVDGLGASWRDMRLIPGAISETSMYLGAILAFALIVTNIATAVVIYPIVRRQSEGVALGYVTARIMECVFILVGLVSIMSVVSVSDALAGGTRGRRPHSLLRVIPSCLRTSGHSCSDRGSLWGRQRLDAGLSDVSLRLGAPSDGHGSH